MNAKPATVKRPLGTSADWHRADVVAALRRAGWTLRRLSAHHGYASATTLAAALSRPWPKGETLIAAAIGIDASQIWPDRHATRRARKASIGPAGRRGTAARRNQKIRTSDRHPGQGMHAQPAGASS